LFEFQNIWGRELVNLGTTTKNKKQSERERERERELETVAKTQLLKEKEGKLLRRWRDLIV
jgi:hypothetical protein